MLSPSMSLDWLLLFIYYRKNGILISLKPREFTRILIKAAQEHKI